MFPQTSDIWLKIHRYVPIWRHQSARIEPCGKYRIDVKKRKVGFSCLAKVMWKCRYLYSWKYYFLYMYIMFSWKDWFYGCEASMKNKKSVLKAFCTVKFYFFCDSRLIFAQNISDGCQRELLGRKKNEFRRWLIISSHNPNGSPPARWNGVAYATTDGRLVSDFTN